MHHCIEFFQGEKKGEILFNLTFDNENIPL